MFLSWTEDTPKVCLYKAEVQTLTCSNQRCPCARRPSDQERSAAVPGTSWQGSWDALYFHKMAYSGLAYYSRWDLNTGPGFLAPEPYVHWHNPAIFLAPSNNATKPVPFPASRRC